VARRRRRLALFRRLPSLRYRPPQWPIVPPEAGDEFAELRDDLTFLDAALLPKFRECDLTALVEQNRHRRQQLILLVAGAAGAVLGAVQAALSEFAWPGVLLALVAVLSAVFAQQVEHGRALQRYLDQRARAERLRSLYFQYLVRVDRYADAERKQRLRDDVAALLTEGSG
jgi:hypothetical protein